ncbi:MAG: hypothetical protein AAF125_26685, partial [Chloroflexota bacterium]
MPTNLHNDVLEAELTAHIRALSAGIGARPAASSAEEAAFAYIRNQLTAYGIEDRRTLRFSAPRTRMSALWLPLLVTAFTNIPPRPALTAADKGVGA